MHHPQRISVVITTYNRSDALLQVLTALCSQDDKDFEVVVADDGSRHEHVEAVFTANSSRLLRLVHVWHPDVGFTASRVRNRGVEAASGDYIVFMDGDCVPEVDFIRRHRSLAQRDFLVNGSRVMLSKGFTRQVLAGQATLAGQPMWQWIFWRIGGAVSKLTGLLRLPDFALRRQERFRWKGIRSCNMGVWRSDFLRINGFDESFVGWGHEDADFVLRLHNAGVQRKNGFCATEVYHLWHQESSREHESVNAETVRERIRTRQTQPLIGFTNSCNGADVVVRRLG